MSDLDESVTRVASWVDGYGVLARGGNDPEIAHSAWVNHEDEPRQLRISDLKRVLEMRTMLRDALEIATSYANKDDEETWERLDQLLEALNG